MRYEENDVGGLHDLCQKILTPNSLVVELGSYSGDSACIFAQYVKTLYCIDPWKDVLEIDATVDGSNFNYKNMRQVERRFDRNTKHFKNIIKIRGSSDIVVDIFGNSKVDLVYIDSLHDYSHVRRDIDKWWRVVRIGGWLGGHNYGDYWPGVIKAIDESFGEPDELFRDTSWIVKKV